MAYLLFPGRHLLNTRFQEEFLFSVMNRPIADLPVVGPGRPTTPLTDVIFAWLLGLAWVVSLITAHRLFLTVRRRRQGRVARPSPQPAG
jgi:hypothetical protein